MDGNFVTKNVNQDSVITFSHSTYYLNSVLVRDIKDSVSLLELNVKHISWNNLFVKNVSHKQLYKLPVNTTFKTDFTFHANFIVVFNDNEMKDNYYPMNHQANYNMNSFSITNQFRSIKADSFNPHGVQKPSHSIVTGSFDYLFEVIGK